MRGQLELFAPGPDLYGSEPDPRKIVVEGDRWVCVRCRRGGMRLVGGPHRLQLRYAREKHRCRPFATDEGTGS